MQDKKSITEEDEDMSIEELNYKKGYAFLFNSISDMIKMSARMLKQMMILQKYSEELCIAEPSEDIEMDTGEILELIVEKIKQNIEEENEND